MSSLTDVELPDALDYCRQHHHSVLVTRKRSGDPQPSPVVHGVDNAGRVVISSREPAYKVRNLRRDPHLTLCAFPDTFFGDWVVLEGTAEIVGLPDAMELLVDLYRQVAGEHLDWDDFGRAMVAERRVAIVFTPVTAGPNRAG